MGYKEKNDIKSRYKNLTHSSYHLVSLINEEKDIFNKLALQYIINKISFGNEISLFPYFIFTGKDNKGKHFIFGFMYSWFTSVPEIFITTDCPCIVNINVSTPLADPNFFQTFTIVRHQVFNVTFSSNIQSGPGTVLSNKGIEITSDEEIAVYAVNKEEFTTDAFAAFPVDTLGENYYVITWNITAEFMIISTEEDTSVSIFVADGTSIVFNSTTFTAGMMLNISMERYQTFHVSGGFDYTGTKVTSNKPITVISGAACIIIGGGFCDHVSSQMTPIETFGKTFVTINMPNCNQPVNFKIVASENNTDVNITGRSLVSLLEPGDKYLFRITDQTSKVVSSTKPIAIAFFAEGGCGFDKGDPAMVLLQPTQQFAADYTFTTIDYPTNPFIDALTIVISEAERSGLKLDGHDISAGWRPIEGSDDLQITDINITKGAHTIYHVNPIVTFLAVSTGIAEYKSYGYLSGQRLAPINSVSLKKYRCPLQIFPIMKIIKKKTTFYIINNHSIFYKVYVCKQFNDTSIRFKLVLRIGMLKYHISFPQNIHRSHASHSNVAYE